ncbi:hypothetical protein A3A76_00515 [Candidatus Woesebacteria bacterium RIFCSPLOWO2_01_FULL_39_23]|uniref:Uncharacterized protein n=1 Tax=Candidatus Woesebacteria bacterium RIFCSPHIGHO2_01_FULL_40_22 TaxID=1802499 RepID=A0A1F7YJX4_9BACT|nr:MAG: hypothetical protein A2141_05870 [Candidatus Woesebacteria bacterium RBG_16_40_11]OGM27179.1 MAG: hypothetical protein A2628_04030 [Candidatus Woesebacteria bacterium RIFCSPHIGHO2_01_FULL_40_22]OGM36915.1 MAG: hypothetical protein A3E41_05080 [Candidatus Woesebacteria bacterium RIFCSPHIGHO2_12_FULL_38_9]OGM63345.1 MAG: hypothetical protein A3A76_00515 [Candidatus Woesebacteria bacterium RIFCSPLOWO2_01_FULL_39_23]
MQQERSGNRRMKDLMNFPEKVAIGGGAGLIVLASVGLLPVYFVGLGGIAIVGGGASIAITEGAIKD